MIPDLYTKLPALYAYIGDPDSVVPSAHVIGLSLGCLHLWSIHIPRLNVGSISRVGVPHATRIEGVTRGGGGGWVGWEEVKLRGILCEIIFARNLLRQFQTSTQPPVGLVPPQSNEYVGDTKNAQLRSRQWYKNPSVNPSTNVGNWFFQFLGHKLNQYFE